MTYPNLLDRFLTYVKVNTRSDEHSTTTPSTPVSYTHLDVYKRQNQRNTSIDNFLYSRKEFQLLIVG